MSETGTVFDRAIALFLQYAEPLQLAKKYPGLALPDRLIVPDKCMIFRLSLQMDDGKIGNYPADSGKLVGPARRDHLNP